MLAGCCFLPRVMGVPGLDAELCAMLGWRGLGALSSTTRALRVGEPGLTAAATSAIENNNAEVFWLCRAAAWVGDKQATAALARAPAQATAALARALAEAAHGDVREEAATWLGKAAARGNEQATAALARALAEDADGAVREEAATALGRVAAEGDEEATASLARALLGDADGGVRWCVGRALGRARA